VGNLPRKYAKFLDGEPDFAELFVRWAETCQQMGRWQLLGIGCKSFNTPRVFT